MTSEFKGIFSYRLNKNATEFCIDQIKVKDKAVIDSLPDSLKPIGRKHVVTVTVTGYNLPAYSGVLVKYIGEWVNSKYGIQMKVTDYQILTPEDGEGILAFMSSGYIKGLGPVKAKAIFDLFGDESLKVIELNPEKLLEIKGISKATKEKIHQSYLKHIKLAELGVFLGKYDISPEKASEIYRIMGVQSLERIRDNPYELLGIDGFYFPDVDRIAADLNVMQDSEIRVRYGISYAFMLAKLNGDLYIPERKIKNDVFQLLNYKMEDVKLFDKHFKMQYFYDRIIKPYADCVFSHETDMAERTFANVLSLMNKTSVEFDYSKFIEDEINGSNSKFQLSERQKEAVFSALSNRISIITGGAGTGKTTVIRTIISVLHAADSSKNIVLLAPTGKAARRMHEVTELESSTIHKAIGLMSGAQGVGTISLPFNSFVIIDESSMIDMFMAKALATAFPKNAQVLFVGDINQLPSVGPGNVLREMIRSGQFPVVTLDHIYRQDDKSLINENAIKVNAGIGGLKSGEDFIYHNASDDSIIQDEIVKEYLSEVARVGAEEVVILCPTRTKGTLSSTELNKVIQKAINPVKEDDVVFRYNGLIYKAGDRVIQLKNTPNLSNGDLGIITDIKMVSDDEGDQLAEVTIQFEDQELVYYKEDMKNISLAYALTIHKSQGAEYKSVLIAIGKDTPKVMLKRNLLYTRITRAKEKCLLFGPPEVFSTCIKTSDISSRKTLLADRICEISKTLKISA